VNVSRTMVHTRNQRGYCSRKYALLWATEVGGAVGLAVVFGVAYVRSNIGERMRYGVFCVAWLGQLSMVSAYGRTYLGRRTQAHWQRRGRHVGVDVGVDVSQAPCDSGDSAVRSDEFGRCLLAQLVAGF
jgi:hypothetical protein